MIADASSLFRLTAAKVSPAVVNIRSFRAGKPDPRNPAANGLQPAGIGSGVIVDKERGLIVTNYHVVRDGEQFIVRPGRGGEYSATIVGVDANTDLAVLQISAPVMVEAAWGDPDTLAVGDWVLAIGSPYNLDQSVSAGIISATGRNNLGIVGEGSYEDFLQTDAAVNPGNSGGPLVNLRGEVVGINTAVSVEGIGNAGVLPGIGLAISANLAKRVVDQIIANGHVRRGYLGVMLQNVPEREAQAMGLPPDRRAYVVSVERGSPADRAGLRAGDVVLTLAGHPVPDYNALRNRASDLAPGSEVVVEYHRAGKTETAKLTVGSPPVLKLLGLDLRDQPTENGGTAVIVADVQLDSQAFRDGVERGAWLVSVGGTEVSTKAEADAAADKLDPNAGIPLKFRLRNGKMGDVVVGGAK